MQVLAKVSGFAISRLAKVKNLEDERLVSELNKNVSGLAIRGLR